MAVATAITKVANRIPESVVSRITGNSPPVRLLRSLINRSLSDETIAASVATGPAKGVILVIEPRREKYYWMGTHELHVQRALASILKENDTFWDVGAHVGFFSLLGGRLVGSRGQVHAFEPLPANRDRLNASIEANGVSNIQVHAEAVAETNGVGTMSVDESSLMGSLAENHGRTPSIQVPCLTLDALGVLLGIPSLIKIDAEGLELSVLKSGRTLFAEEKTSVIVEFMSDEDVLSAKALMSQYDFQNLGENHWYITPPCAAKP